MSGRVDEALAYFDTADHPGLGPFGDLAGILNALALVLVGRGPGALPLVERAEVAAEALDAPPTSAAAHALRAEITGEEIGPEHARAPATSIAEAVVLRSLAVRGDTAALVALEKSASRLAVPGLLLGLR